MTRFTPVMRDTVVQLAKRRKGVTIPEIVDRWEVSWYAANRAIKRLQKEGRLHRTSRKRRRDLLFEIAGRGATIYKAQPKEMKIWVGSQNSQKPRSSRARSRSPS